MTRHEQAAHAIRVRFADRQLVLVSNREPYVHRRTKDGVDVDRPPGGLVEALDPIMQAVGGLWIAWGSGSADQEVVDGRDQVRVPPEDPRYTLRRVWLSEQVVERYYYGYANQALWPLCHLAVDKARFRRRYWEGYVEANDRFAGAAAEEALPGALVWLQDYHLALVPRMIRALRQDLLLAHFWHIPWPAWDLFRACPQAQRTALLDGLLGNDLLGFHTERFRRTFLECVERDLDADVNFEDGYVDYAGHRTVVRVFPISIDVERFEEMAASAAGERWMARWRARPGVGDRAVFVGVDRLDYTKGIPDRLRAIDRFLRRNPQAHGRFVFVQKAAPSRTRIKAYQELAAEVARLVEEINSRYGRADWRPILYVLDPVPRVGLAALYRLADGAIVSSLQDGMNLVAKEFIACQLDLRGVLLLSELSGAAEEMPQAILINPYDEEGFAEAIRQGLEMPAEERRRRMEVMRAYLRQHDIYWWMEEVVGAAMRLAARKMATRYLFDAPPALAPGDRSVVLFLDYDGTLVPIAPTPEEARPPEAVVAVLRALAEQGFVVAIVSGRSAAEVRDLLGLEGILYFGNHGLEVDGQLAPAVGEAGSQIRGHVRQVVEEIQRRLRGIAGVLVENKGLSASIHYRQVDPTDLDRVKHAVSAAVEAGRPWVQLTSGKKVLEIRPHIPWDKGRAVLWWLQQHFGDDWADRILPVYIGDDRTDEDAFGVLAGHGITVAVAPEGPTAAGYHLRDPAEVLEFLRRLAFGRNFLGF